MRPEVLIFMMDGCGACHDLRPLAERLAAHYGACVDTKFIDVDHDGGLSDAMAVEETPTVIGVNAQRQPVIRMVGHDGGVDRLVKVYSAVAGRSCLAGRFGDV